MIFDVLEGNSSLHHVLVSGLIVAKCATAFLNPNVKAKQEPWCSCLFYFFQLQTTNGDCIVTVPDDGCYCFGYVYPKRQNKHQIKLPNPDLFHTPHVSCLAGINCFLIILGSSNLTVVTVIPSLPI